MAPASATTWLTPIATSRQKDWQRSWFRLPHPGPDTKNRRQGINDRLHRGLKPLGLKWQHVFHLLALVASPVRNSVHPKPESSSSAGKTDSFASCAGPAIGFRLKCDSERVERNIRGSSV